MVVLQTPLEIGSISTLLSLDDFDVPHCLKRISSLIVDGMESLTERTVPQLHKSVVDYLVSSRPHPDLRINTTEQHHSLTTACFKSIQRLTFNVGHTTTSYQRNEKIFPTYDETSSYKSFNDETSSYKDMTSSISQCIAYPCQWLGHHLENGGELATLVPDVENFMMTQFLQWLEVLSLRGLVWLIAVSTLKILVKQIKVSIHHLTKYGY